MRKLKPSEVAFLVAGLAIGSGNIEATENPQVIATVTVTASRISVNAGSAFSFPVGMVNPGTLPANSGTNDPSLQAQYRHAIECAIAYGQPRGGIPKDGFVTYFNGNYGWGRGFDVYATTTTDQAPPGTGWVKTYGFTTYSHPAYPYIRGQSQIFIKSNVGTRELIDTLAHEWAHQWQDSARPIEERENAATAVGQAVAQAYVNDAGRLCGGL